MPGTALPLSFMQCGRLALLLGIAWLIRDRQVQLRVQGDWPVSVAEVRAFLPRAKTLKVDRNPVRRDLIVLDGKEQKIGYALRTMPYCREIIGYSGPIDALVVFDENFRAIGVAIRHSYDTPSHVEDVSKDLLFMESWNGKSREEISRIEDFDAAGIYAVSGATRTSEALRESITLALKSDDASAKENSVEWAVRDWILLSFFLLGCAFAFVKKQALQRWRWVFSVLTVGLLGWWMGDLMAQSLLVGWMERRIPFEQTPGLVLFAAAVFLIPWFTGQPVYCQYICPHGNLQRWAMKLLPAQWSRTLSEDGKWILRWIPVMLLAVVITASFLSLDFDLAGIEPFDAYLIRSAGWATIGVAMAGLLLSLFFPMIYCKYGCPTGWLLEFIRRRSDPGRFGMRDWAGLMLLAWAIFLYVTKNP